MITNRPFPVDQIIHGLYYEKQKEHWEPAKLSSITLGILDFNELYDNHKLQLTITPRQNIYNFMEVPIKISHRRPRLIRLNWRLTREQKNIRKLGDRVRYHFFNQFNLQPYQKDIITSFTTKKS